MPQDQAASRPQPSPQATPKRTLGAGAWHLLRRHPLGVVQGAFLLLVLVVVLQNLEPTSLDVLFWSLASVPKLVLILAAMLAGGVLWEILRRLLLRQR